MAEDDIYKSKRTFERYLSEIEEYKKPKGRRKYYCKCTKNLTYFYQLKDIFEAKDLSYIRRCKIFRVFLLITYAIDKDLKKCDRTDLDKIVAFSHKRHKTVKSKSDFIKDLKCIWRMLFPDKDHLGRPDETLTPYVVRHISRKIDKSKEKLRNDRLTFKDFMKIVQYFDKDPKIQAYLMLAFESLGRPQELLYTKVKDYEFYDEYAKIWISEHGKEGCGFLQCIDSYPYIQKWFKIHPLRNNPEAYFFINQSNRNLNKQLTNTNINKRLRNACKHLGIKKSITCYSLKRNGITYRRIRGDSDTQIQHAARWTSTKQLKVYDMSNQEDALKVELIKRGLVDATKEEEKRFKPQFKKCQFCGVKNGFTTEFCTGCHRPMNRKKIQEIAKKNEMLENDEFIEKMKMLEERMNELTMRK